LPMELRKFQSLVELDLFHFSELGCLLDSIVDFHNTRDFDCGGASNSRLCWWSSRDFKCRNPSFRLATKAKGLKGCRPGGSQGKEAARVRTKRKPGSHITNSRECEKVWGSVREWTLTLPRQLPLWEIESRWTPETSESNFRSQNSMACDFICINGKLLKRRCLKWAHIANLDIWNTSYGQKKGRESN
jgi:hypothetical protein